jgi:hypothetical protein
MDITSLKSKVYLRGFEVVSSIDSNPKVQFFSLVYIYKKREIDSDIGGYRPDPLDYLKPGKKYNATLYFSHEIINGEDICKLKKIEVGDNIFVRVR